MNIVLTIHQFAPDYLAGTEILTLETALELRRRGHSVSIFTGYPAQVELRDEERFDSYTYEGIEVDRFHHAAVPMAGQSNVAEAEYNGRLFGVKFEEYLRKRRPDIVQFFHLARLSASAIDACFRTGTPAIYSPTDFWAVCPLIQLRLPDDRPCRGPEWGGVNCVRHFAAISPDPEVQRQGRRHSTLAFALAAWAIRRGFLADRLRSLEVRALVERPHFIRQRLNQLDRIIVPTELMRSIFKRCGIRASKMVRVPFGLRQDHIVPSPGKGESDALRIGYIGTLYEHKGVHVLIEAVKSIPASTKVELKLYGKLDEFPDYVARLRTLAAGDGRIQFNDRFPNSAIGGVFAGLDLLVVPSLWYENTPLVIASAQAAGCPVVVSDLGGMVEAIRPGVDGCCFRPGDSSDLARTLIRLAENRNLVREMARSARRPRDMKQYVDDLLEIYDRVSVKRTGRHINGEGSRPSR